MLDTPTFTNWPYPRTSALAIGLLLFAAISDAQTVRPGRLSKEEVAGLRPGLKLQFVNGPNDDAGDARILRVAALHVPRGTAPSPFVVPGRFTVHASGYLKLPLKGEHNFHIVATGPLKLLVNDEVVYQYDGEETESAIVPGLALVKGYNKIGVLFTGADHRDAGFRTGWSSADFAEEPLPPDALFTRGDEPALATGLQRREGRELFATRGCAQCHSLGDQVPLTPREGGMPELAFEGPSLRGVGSRLNEAWLREWLREPKKLRPTATMPQVLHGDEMQQAQAAADITAYLLTLDGEALQGEEPTDESASAGLALFENLGCIACHNTKPLTEEDTFARRSLHFVNAKFAPGALQVFLKAPQAHYAWSRMPDFKLSDDEAASLTAFLQSRALGVIAIAEDAPKGDAARGKQLFGTAGCASCHSVGEPTAARKTVVAVQDITKGCLAAETTDKVPHFGFTDDQRAALLAFLATDRLSLLRETPADFSLRQVQTLNCIACHRRDGVNSLLSAVLEEEGEQGLTPPVLPLLTWTGEKLKPEWTHKLLTGELDQRARPWLKARMPAFPTRAKLLAVGLSHEHGFSTAENARPAHDAALAKVGEQLVGESNGLSCIKCHAIGKRPPLAPFEAPGINLVSAAERLRYSYYPRWMLDPPRVDVLTKMPKFAADGKTTGVTAVFEGHAARQYEALWHYLQTLPVSEPR